MLYVDVWKQKRMKGCEGGMGGAFDQGALYVCMEIAKWNLLNN
jgi:hypothetical protein